MKIVVYLNQFGLILTLRKPKFSKKNEIFFTFFWWETDKLSIFFLFRQLMQISSLFRVLELNLDTNSQRYIGFNFDHTNNYFYLKSEIFTKLHHFLSKLEILDLLRKYVISLKSHNFVKIEAYTTLRVSKRI